MDNSNNGSSAGNHHNVQPNSFNRLFTASHIPSNQHHQETQGSSFNHNSNNRYSFKNISPSYNSYEDQAMLQQYQSPHFNPNEFQTESSHYLMNLHTSSIDSENFSSITNPLSQISQMNYSNVQHSQQLQQNQLYPNKNINVQHPNQVTNQQAHSSYQQNQRSLDKSSAHQNQQNSGIQNRPFSKMENNKSSNDSRHPFKGGVEFDQIFQKEYFEDVLNPPGDSSISNAGDMSSQRSSPFKSDTGKLSINSILKDSAREMKSHSALGMVGQNLLGSLLINQPRQDLSPQRGTNFKQNSHQTGNPLSLTQHIHYQVNPQKGFPEFQDFNQLQDSNRQKETPRKQWRDALQNIKAAEQACEDDNILESMSQLLKAVNDLKISKNENSSQNLFNNGFDINARQQQQTMSKEHKISNSFQRFMNEEMNELNAAGSRLS